MQGYIGQEVRRSPWQRAAARYLVAAACVAVGLILASWMDPLVDASDFLLAAVLVAAWFSGLAPALMASLLATLALDYFFPPPFHQLTPEPAHVPRLLLFALVAMLFAGASAGRRRVERSLKQLHDELDAKVQERTAELTLANREAIAAQKRYADLVNSIEGIVWEADARTLQYSFVSQQAERVLGYPVNDWLSRPTFWQDHIHADDRASAVRSRRMAATDHREHDFEYRMVAADGRVVWLRDVVTVVAGSHPPTSLRGVMLDVTDRKRAAQELEELAGRLINAQEQERSRIGRELHDHISQMLGVLTIKIDQLRADAATPPAMAAAVVGLREDTTQVTDDVHSLSHRLHSSALDYLGLVPALQRLISEFSARHGIAVAFAHTPLPRPLPSDTALCLFRVTEESLTNIAKHSHAKSARIDLSATAEALRLTVEDSGDGFDPAALARRGGLGFVSMRERLRALRGVVRVESTPARGTTIDVWLPMPGPAVTARTEPLSPAPDAATT